MMIDEVKVLKKGFDNEKYLKMQSEHIKERIAQFGNKLYLEFGGKLFDDYHASRVLPGFEPDSKLQMLLQLKDQAEVVIVISAEDIEENKIRGDYGITYDMDVLRLIDEFQSVGLFVGSVCLCPGKTDMRVSRAFCWQCLSYKVCRTAGSRIIYEEIRRTWN